MALLPFHALISTWGGTTIGPYEVWKTWKELLLLLLFIPAAALIFSQRDLRSYLISSWIIRLAVLYTLLHIIIALAIGQDQDATLYGLAINLRLIGFFFISIVAFWNTKIKSKFIASAILVPCIAVLVFGLLQMFVLPTNFLQWFGYEKGVTITPSLNIDEQPDQIRIMSTLRGPNPLGAYLILPGMLLLALAARNIEWVKNKLKLISVKHLLVFAATLFALAVVLYGTHGRASWIGFVVAAGTCAFLLLPKKIRPHIFIVGTAVVVLTSVLVYQYRSSSFVQNVIFHDNPETGAVVTSNDAHLEAAEQGLRDIVKEPLRGCGPGCAGPASFYNENGIRLAENYYLQIGQEVGVFGILMFITLCILVGVKLFKIKEEPLALALLASLIGIAAANLLLHVWADDTLAYVWWGAAGAVIATYSRPGSETASARRLRTSGQGSSRPSS